MTTKQPSRKARCKKAEKKPTGVFLANVSAHNSEPVRGRPRSFSQLTGARVAALFPDVRSQRGRQNKALMCRAIKAIRYGRKFAWLGLGTRDEYYGPPTHATVLAELGRIGSADGIRLAAETLCKVAPSNTRQAIDFVRSFRRRGHETGPCAMAMASRINDTIRSYMAGFPFLGAEDVLNALDAVGAQWPRDQGFEDQRVQRLIDDAQDRTDAIKVMMTMPRSPSRTAAAAAVLIMPEFARLASYRCRAGGSGKTPRGPLGSSAEQAAKLFGVSCRYIADAHRLRDSNPRLFSDLLNGRITLIQAFRKLARESA